MPHIHTEPGEHDFTASAYIVRVDQEEPKLLLHRHKKLGVFMQFGGHVELKETPWQAVAHEVREESGYEFTQLTLLQPVSRIHHLSEAELHPMPLVLNTHAFNQEHSHIDIAWAFTVGGPPKHPVAQGESNGLQLFTRQELVEISSKTIFENVREIGLFVLDTCLKEWEEVAITTR